MAASTGRHSFSELLSFGRSKESVFKMPDNGVPMAQNDNLPDRYCRLFRHGLQSEIEKDRWSTNYEFYNISQRFADTEMVITCKRKRTHNIFFLYNSNMFPIGNGQHFMRCFQFLETSFQFLETSFQIFETSYQFVETRFQLLETRFQLLETSFHFFWKHFYFI